MGRRRPRMLVAALAAAACRAEAPELGPPSAEPSAATADSPPASAPVAPAHGAASAPAASSTVAPAGREMFARICREASCAGPFAKLELWRDASGGLGVVFFLGDLARCSHPPGIYFDAAGAVRWTVPMRPVVRGSAEHAELERKHAAEIEGLVRAESLLCRDVLTPSDPSR